MGSNPAGCSDDVRGVGKLGLIRLDGVQEIVGSNPTTSTDAMWGSWSARHFRKVETVGSSPTIATAIQGSSTVEPPAVNRKVVGSSPTPGADWKGKPTGMTAAVSKTVELAQASLVGSSPTPSALVSLAERARHRLPKPIRRVRLPQDTLGDRLTVGQRTLNPRMKVRALLPD